MDSKTTWTDGDDFPDFMGSEAAPRIARQHLCNFGGGKGGTSGTQTVQARGTSGPPQWASGAAEDNYMRLQAAVNVMPGPYTGQRVAGLPAGALDAIRAMTGNIGATNPAFAAAQGVAQNVQGYNPQQVQAGQIGQTDLNPYMNPYQQQVIDRSLNTLDQQRLRALNGVSDDAMRAGAFGGSRHGVMAGVTNAEAASAAGDLSANLNAQNFAQAQGAAGQDIATRLQAALSNQNADLQGAALNLNAAQAGGALAGAGQEAYLRSILASLQGSGMEQTQQQNELNAAQQLYNEQRLDPVQRYQTNLDALAGIRGVLPTETNSTQTSQFQQQQGGGSGVLSGLGGILGLGTSLLSPLGGATGAFGAPAGSFGSSLLGGMLGWLSDERVKDDHGVVGQSHGVDVHEWSYKGDDTVHTGPMAQDLERGRYRGAVRTDPRTGLKVVDQRKVPEGLRVNGLSVEAVNPGWRKKKRSRR